MFILGFSLGLFLGLLAGCIISPFHRWTPASIGTPEADYSPSEFVGEAEGIPLGWSDARADPKK